MTTSCRGSRSCAPASITATLQTLAPIDLGHGTHALQAARTIRIMLADLDRFRNMTPDEADDPVNVARRTSLLADFRVLRSLLD